jgi:hypothetical protein
VRVERELTREDGRPKEPTSAGTSAARAPGAAAAAASGSEAAGAGTESTAAVADAEAAAQGAEGGVAGAVTFCLRGNGAAGVAARGDPASPREEIRWTEKTRGGWSVWKTRRVDVYCGVYSG